jgi:large subunit ribosomal protein L18
MRRLFKNNKNGLRKIRHARVRAALKGTATRPRLSVFRSLRSVYAQLIDDTAGKTLCAVATKEVKGEKAEGYAAKSLTAYLVGKKLAEKAKAKGIAKAVFDRGGYQYHGRVKAVAEGARAGGLEF